MTASTRLEKAENYHSILKRDGKLVVQQCQEKVQQATDQAVQKLDMVIRGTECRLPEVVGKFTEREQFNEDLLESYTLKLCDHIDKELSDMLEREKVSSLDRAHEQVKADVLSESTIFCGVNNNYDCKCF